jgi:carbamate kinase
MLRTAVIALGGNAFTREGQTGTYEEQRANALAMASTVAAVRAAGWAVVVVHGNGPQVGNLAIQNEEGRAIVPGQPLFSLGAMTQGELGSLICLAMAEADPQAEVCALVTHVLVDRDDPAFEHPTKPIGPFFTAERAAQLAAERGWQVTEDSGRGYRRVVASPRPTRIVESAAVRRLVESGTVVVAGGGGGVPVVQSGSGLTGAEAVIDKDYVAAQLAIELGAAALVLVTGVPHVMLDFGSPAQRPLLEVDAVELESHLRAGHFAEGSMAPKVRAACRFLQTGGGLAVITTPELVPASLDGAGGGTRVVTGRSAAAQVPAAPHRPDEEMAR